MTAAEFPSLAARPTAPFEAPLEQGPGHRAMSAAGDTGRSPTPLRWESRCLFDVWEPGRRGLRAVGRD